MNTYKDIIMKMNRDTLNIEPPKTSGEALLVGTGSPEGISMALYTDGTVLFYNGESCDWEANSLFKFNPGTNIVKNSAGEVTHMLMDNTIVAMQLMSTTVYLPTRKQELVLKGDAGVSYRGKREKKLESHLSRAKIIPLGG